ncbi:MAG: divalent-cation tolerance protein CutA [Balneolaceae bacterium]
MYNNLRLAYITTANREEARIIGRSLVDNKLAACVNIIDGMESIYRWKGKISEDKETILLAKTHYTKMKALTDHVKGMHSYDCPCIISFSINEEGGNEDYKQWLLGELKK